MQDFGWIAEKERLVEEFGIRPDSPPFPDGAAVRSLDDAVRQLRIFLKRDFDFNDDWVIESENWWYIPYGFIGCAGIIMDKLDGYVNALGSCYDLDLYFWAHNQNIKYEYADLTVTKVKNLQPTIATLMKMGNRAPLNPIPNKSDSAGNRTMFLTRENIAEQLANLPVTFANQSLWFTIGALKKSFDADDFSFSVKRGSWDQSP
ncbi:hypothetical protein [Blastopirellula marina]|uniref:Uncharacterized protein n=1 Tax=Blastopirellula marina TaxID=124 RepID=A0A2S8GMW8_9BACT|nr:hypothetical protein [Blastopirellula marina]PQO45772.1 hypothetical protein C5Y93_12660 [Blastopirellula marina]